MKRFVQKKVSKFVLVGLVLNVLPVSVFAQAERITQEPVRLTKFSTLYLNQPERLSRKKIDRHLRQIQKTSISFSSFAKKIQKSIKVTDKWLSGLKGLVMSLVGGIIISTGLTTAAATTGAVAATTATTGVGILALFNSPIVAAILISTIGLQIFLLPANIISFGITASAITAFLAILYGPQYAISIAYMKRLEKEERNYPGTLTQEDLNIIKIFKNVLKGPVVIALLKGKKLKESKKEIAKQALENDRQFYMSKSGSEKIALKDIINYVFVQDRIPGLGAYLYPKNLNIRWYNYLKYMSIKEIWEIINDYKIRKKTAMTQGDLNIIMKDHIAYMKEKYDAMSKNKKILKRLSPEYSLLNAKELALRVDLRYAFAQNTLNSDLKKVKKLEKKYGSQLYEKLKQPVKEYGKQKAEILFSLSVME